MKRLQFDMPKERVAELDQLVERTGLKTRTQLINSALTLFEWAVKERESGRIISSLDEATGKYKELEMPGFPVTQIEAEKNTGPHKYATVEEAYSPGWKVQDRDQGRDVDVIVIVDGGTQIYKTSADPGVVEDAVRLMGKNELPPEALNRGSRGAEVFDSPK